MSTSPNWKLNAHGIVSGLKLHDGYFHGVVAEKDGTVKLMVQSSQDDSYVILLKNVRAMNVTNFWGGDIIQDVRLISIQKISPLMLRKLFQGRFNEAKKMTPALKENGQKYFFSLESSYGAEIYATCDEMLIEHG